MGWNINSLAQAPMTGGSLSHYISSQEGAKLGFLTTGVGQRVRNLGTGARPGTPKIWACVGVLDTLTPGLSVTTKVLSLPIKKHDSDHTGLSRGPSGPVSSKVAGSAFETSKCTDPASRSPGIGCWNDFKKPVRISGPSLYVLDEIFNFIFPNRRMYVAGVRSGVLATSKGGVIANNEVGRLGARMN